MSRRQTRRAVSLTRELYDDLLAFAAAHGFSAAQVVRQGIRAVLSGAIALEPAADPTALAKETAATRAAAKRAGLAPAANQPPPEPAPGVEQIDDWGPV